MNKLKLQKHINDTIEHKIHVLRSARILSNYLLEHGEKEKAVELIRRCIVHDNSKFSDVEINAFTSLDGNISNLIDPKEKLSKIKQDIIEIHWKNNRHHPEHFKNVEDMTEMDIMEMACDCHARSIEFDTDLIDFIEVRQKERFMLPENIYSTYKKYCTILVNNASKHKIKEREIN